MIYLLPANPLHPIKSLKRLREQARRAGYLVNRDRHTGTWSLIDARLHLPLLGLDRVGLPAIAQAIEEVRSSPV
jgi:hypothetical protein